MCIGLMGKTLRSVQDRAFEYLPRCKRLGGIELAVYIV